MSGSEWCRMSGSEWLQILISDNFSTPSWFVRDWICCLWRRILQWTTPCVASVIVANCDAHGHGICKLLRLSEKGALKKCSCFSKPSRLMTFVNSALSMYFQALVAAYLQACVAAFLQASLAAFLEALWSFVSLQACVAAFLQAFVAAYLQALWSFVSASSLWLLFFKPFLAAYVQASSGCLFTTFSLLFCRTFNGCFFANSVD